jgi:glycosyltransferase involved in cell wall biosynthesis
MTRVSVVIPVYNHEQYLAEALESVVAQTHADLQIVCVEDGSTDESLTRLLDWQVWASRDVLVIAQDNAGAHSALNRGLSLCDGDLIMVLNSDDRYLPARAATFARTWERCGRPRDFWGFAGIQFIDDSGAVVDPSGLGLGRLSEYNHHAVLGAWVPELLPWHNVAVTSGNLVMSRPLADAVGDFLEHRHVHDWDMALRLLARVDPVVVPLPLYEYRIHGSNTFASIAGEQSERESLEVREAFRAALLARTTSAPYAEQGIPFVDHLRTRVPLRAAFSGS